MGTEPSHDNVVPAEENDIELNSIQEPKESDEVQEAVQEVVQAAPDPRQSRESRRSHVGSVRKLYGQDGAARDANDHERTMGLKYALKYYFPAMMWAVLMAAPIIMEGYETALVPNFFSFDSFQRHYGRKIGEGDLATYVIPSMWQAGITVAAAAGQLIGLWLAPQAVNRIGYRRSSIIGLAFAGCFFQIGFWSSFAKGQAKLAVYLIGEFALGVPWGLFQGLTLPYVSDITPLQLRGISTTMINIYWLMGQFVSSGALRGFGEIKNNTWSFRAPMLVQYSWLLPLVYVAWAAPESPLVLSRKGRREEAARTLRRLTTDPQNDIDGRLSAMETLNEHEAQSSSGMGFMGCLQGGNLRRTEIAVIAYLTQQLVGSPLIYYSVKLLRKSGLDQNQALGMTMGMYAACICASICSMWLMRWVSRRRLWIGGLIAEVTCLIIIGTVGFFLKTDEKDGLTEALRWVIATIVWGFAIVYNMTIGPVCYTIVAETPSTRLKAATNAISRASYILLTVVNLFLVPKLLEDKPDGWGLGPRAALVWASTASICAIWAYFRLPEMKDRTSAEIDILFKRGISARKWKGMTV